MVEWFLRTAWKKTFARKQRGNELSEKILHSLIYLHRGGHIISGGYSQGKGKAKTRRGGYVCRYVFCHIRFV